MYNVDFYCVHDVDVTKQGTVNLQNLNMEMKYKENRRGAISSYTNNAFGKGQIEV